MARKPKTYERKSFETKRPGRSDQSNEPYAGIYLTMLMSEAYKSLSNGAKALYPYMKLQYKCGKNKNAGLKDDQFYFNRRMQKTYGFNNPNQFNKYRNELIEKGFIKMVECGKNTRTKNVYQFSDQWQSYKAVSAYDTV